MARYQIFRTDADLSQEPGDLIAQSESYDIAETVMSSHFIQHYPHRDYMIYDATKREIPVALFTPRTLQQRGEV